MDPSIPNERRAAPPSSHSAQEVIRALRERQGGRAVSGRYELHDEIGHGGVGAVFRGRDRDLGRDVAMKLLHEKHADRPELLARFVEEAQIGGQLQHPGIVPVYEIGLQAGERRWFTTKLVKGETLAALLARRRDLADKRRRFPGEAIVVRSLANRLCALDHYDESIEWCRKAIAAVPDQAPDHYNLAIRLAESGNVDEAIAPMERAVEL